MTNHNCTRRPHGDRPARNVYGSRSPVLGSNGMVATSQPMASIAALNVLQEAQDGNLQNG